MGSAATTFVDGGRGCGVVPAQVPSMLSHPLQILGHYTLLERVSVGGMAEVFRARDERERPPTRFLALKRVLPGLAEDPAFLDMFVDEARLAVQLHHANICDIFELGQQGDEHARLVPLDDAVDVDAGEKVLLVSRWHIRSPMCLCRR
jgi:serine/threonine protein kinase